MTDKQQVHDIALEIAKAFVSMHIKDYKDETNPEDEIIHDFIQVYKDATEKLEKNNY